MIIVLTHQVQTIPPSLSYSFLCCGGKVVEWNNFKCCHCPCNYLYMYSFSAWSIYSNMSWHEKYHRKLWPSMELQQAGPSAIRIKDVLCICLQNHRLLSSTPACTVTRKLFCASCRHQYNVVFINTSFVEKSVVWIDTCTFVTNSF